MQEKRLDENGPCAGGHIDVQDGLRQAHPVATSTDRLGVHHPGGELGRKLKVELPISEGVYNVLYQGKDAALAVGELMGRALKDE